MCDGSTLTTSRIHNLVGGDYKLSFVQFDLLRDVEFLYPIAWGAGAESR